jgi:hypothetical protein
VKSARDDGPAAGVCEPGDAELHEEFFSLISHEIEVVDLEGHRICGGLGVLD